MQFHAAISANWHLKGDFCREGEMESTRRIKTEFLVQLDGASTKSDERVLVIGTAPPLALPQQQQLTKQVIGVAGATNRPQELDEAARRRFVKRLYIPLPDEEARLALVKHLLKKNVHSLQEEDIALIVQQTAGLLNGIPHHCCTLHLRHGVVNDMLRLLWCGHHFTV